MVFAENVTPIVLGPPARHPFLFILWFEWQVRRALKRYKADVFISPDGYLSLGSSIPQLAVIHDLNFEHYPEDLPAMARWYLRRYFPRFAQKATRIATVSEYSKSDIIKQYVQPEDKIDVIYNGVSKSFVPLDPSTIEETRRQYADGCPYFLYVGAIHPRKNISRMLQAYDRFRSSNESNIKMLIVGERYWWNEEMKKTFAEMHFSEDVIFTGHVDFASLCNIMASAFALTYVSYFEGFGIPVIEAMQCQVPVLTSNQTSLPEVAGDAALIVNPFDVGAITVGMERLWKEEELRGNLVQKGITRVAQFSWDHTADRLWQSIEKLV